MDAILNDIFYTSLLRNGARFVTCSAWMCSCTHPAKVGLARPSKYIRSMLYGGTHP